MQACELNDEEIMAIFNDIDTNGNGLLDEDELRTLCRRSDMPEQYAKLCIRIVGEDKDEITFDQYKEFLKILGSYSNNKEEFLDQIFSALDEDHSGTLEIEEVEVFLACLGIECTQHLAAQALRVADDNSDMRLNRKEFKYLVEGLEAAFFE